MEFLCAGTDAATRFALVAGNWWTGQVRPTTFAQCRGGAAGGGTPPPGRRGGVLKKKTNKTPLVGGGGFFFVGESECSFGDVYVIL